MIQSLLTAAPVAASKLPSRWRAAGLGLLLAGAAALPAHAQLGYSAADASIVAGTYTDLGTGGTAVAMSDPDDANSAPENIGFTFQFAGQSFTQFIMNTNGFIKLGSTAPSAANLYYSDPQQYIGTTPFSSTDPADEYIISPFNYDLEPAATGGGVDFRVETSGAAPNRVCTIQWKNVSDKTLGAANKQYSRFSFQVKLHETTNVIEFVYSAPTQAAGAAGYRGADVGLRGATGTTDFLTSTKASSTPWNDTDFLEEDYGDPMLGYNRHNFRKDVNPANGLTYRFMPQQANDMAVAAVYALGVLPIPQGAPHVVQAMVINKGANLQSSVAVTLTVTGSVTFTDTQTLTGLLPGDTILVSFAGYTPTAAGNNQITVTVPADDNNSNNEGMYTQEVVTNGLFSYADNGPATTSYGLSQNPGIWVVRYNTPTPSNLLAVNAFIGNDPGVVGKVHYAVLMDASGTVLARTPNYTITTGDLDQYHSFTFATPPTVAAGDFYVGMAQVTVGNWFPMGVQDEIPPRPNTYFIRIGLTTGALQDLVDQIPVRLMIQAQLGTATGLTQETLERAVEVYPNPTTGVAKVSLNQTGARRVSLRVLDNLGRVVFTGAGADNATQQIDLSHLSKGLYTLQVSLDEQVVTKQLSVQK